MTIDHICFAVVDIEKAVDNWIQAFGYRQMTEIVSNSRQQVRVVFLDKKNSVTVKLIEPFKENKTVSSFIKRGGSFHHLCFRCKDMEAQIEELNSIGVMTLVAPQPGEAFENEDIAFMLTRFGINIELIATDKKAKLIKLV